MFTTLQEYNFTMGQPLRARGVKLRRPKKARPTVPLKLDTHQGVSEDSWPSARKLSTDEEMSVSICR